MIEAFYESQRLLNQRDLMNKYLPLIQQLWAKKPKMNLHSNKCETKDKKRKVQKKKRKEGSKKCET